MRQRVAVYGGTFDPIHNGHLRVAEAILTAFAMDCLLFVPAFIPPHKRWQRITSAFDRVAMLALATANEERMFVSAVEVESPERPYTIETLGRLQAKFPDSQLFFVMGADSFLDVTMWREHEKLLSEYDIIVATRPGYDDAERRENIASHLAPELQARCIDLRGGKVPLAENFTAPHIYLTDYVALDVSATGIRESAEKGLTISEMVPAAVANYIRKYQLYRKS